MECFLQRAVFNIGTFDIFILHVFFPRNVFKLLSSSVLLSVTAVMTEIVYTPN